MITFKIVALLSPVFICAIFGILYLPYTWTKSKAKTIIKYLMFTGLIFSLVIIFNQTQHYLLLSYVIPLFYSCLLLLIPLFYLYIRSLTSEWVPIVNLWYHFVPAMVYLVVPYILLLLTDKTSRVNFLSELYQGNDQFEGTRRLLYYCFISNKLIFAVQVILYFFTINRLLKQNRKIINDLFSQNENFKLKWLSILNFAFVIGAINGIIINLLPTTLVNQDKYFLAISLFLFTGFFLIMGILGNIQLPIIQIIENKDNNFQIYEKEAYKSPLMKLIEEYVVEKQAFRNPALDIWDIAKALGTNRTYISSTLNKETGLNFNAYINKIRIDEVVNRINSTYLSVDLNTISLECGFNSKSTFYRNFKAYTGISPLEMIKQKK